MLSKTVFIIFTLPLAISAEAQVITFKTSHSNITEAEIRNELKKYPEKILKEYLDTIFVINDERFCGRASMFKHFEICGNCDNEFIKEVIHHEFSSVLLQRYDLYVKEVYNEIGRKFTEWNGTAYPYNTEVVVKPIDPNSDLANYYYGSIYAQTDFENDFNTIAQHLFTHGKDIIKAVSAKPETPISKKVESVINFYKTLDQRFDSAYFSRL